MLRVVADANVLISAALARSPNAPSVLTLDAALDGRLELITSPLVLREIASVLARPRLRKYLSADEALRFVTDLAGQTTLLTDPAPPHPAVCRDPDDDYLVALATATMRTRSSPATTTCSRSTANNSRSTSSHHGSSSTGSADPAFLRFFRTAFPRADSTTARVTVQPSTTALWCWIKAEPSVGTRKASSTAARWS